MHASVVAGVQAEAINGIFLVILPNPLVASDLRHDAVVDRTPLIERRAVRRSDLRVVYPVKDFVRVHEIATFAIEAGSRP